MTYSQLWLNHLMKSNGFQWLCQKHKTPTYKSHCNMFQMRRESYIRSVTQGTCHLLGLVLSPGSVKVSTRVELASLRPSALSGVRSTFSPTCTFTKPILIRIAFYSIVTFDQSLLLTKCRAGLFALSNCS